MNGKLSIAERIPRYAQKELMTVFKARILKLSSGLDVSVQLGVTSNGFVNAEIEGSDSEFFVELIKRRIGLAPSSLSMIEVDDNFKAFVNLINANRQSIEVEIGPASTNVKSEIVKEALIAQLCDGKNIAVDRVAQAYCIQEGTPILVRIRCIDPERGQITAWISDDQVARFDQWRRERTHRIIAVGGSHEKLNEAIRLSKVQRDIIQTEELSFTANSLVCKLGTDAPGIIAKMGHYVREFKLYAFLPERLDKLRTGLSNNRFLAKADHGRTSP